MSPRKGFAEEREDYTRIGVIYARYSSHNQKEESIEQQVEECMAFAKLNRIKIIQVYADKALSGRTDKRPQFQKMMRDAEKKDFSVVVAYKSNRIARDMLSALKYEDRLSQYGIETLYAKEEFGNTAAGRFALRTMMNVNQFYSENMAEDIKRGMRDNAENCKVNGALPLGYVKGTDGRYAIDPKEAAIVREIFDKVLDGVAFADIANELNARGIKTKQGNLWNKNSFHRMVTNDVYIGVYRHSGFVKEDGVPPILEKEVFFAMQKHLATKKNPRGRHRENNDYLLTGKLRCGYCRSYMVGVSGTSRTGDKHYYYTCNDRRTGGSCKKENVRKDYIERVVAELTQRFILQDEVIEWIADNAMDLLSSSGSEAEIAEMEAEVAENRKATKNIMSAIEQGIFTATTKERLLELEQNISDLERSIALARAATESSTVTKEHIIWHLRKLKDGNIENKDFQKNLINTFVKEVYLWDDNIEIDYYYTGKRNSITKALSELGLAGNSGVQSVLTSTPGGHHSFPRPVGA
jgi:DNA invertase Pin-like site-specific DNA recombinase